MRTKVVKEMIHGIQRLIQKDKKDLGRESKKIQRWVLKNKKVNKRWIQRLIQKIQRVNRKIENKGIQRCIQGDSYNGI